MAARALGTAGTARSTPSTSRHPSSLGLHGPRMRAPGGCSTSSGHSNLPRVPVMSSLMTQVNVLNQGGTSLGSGGTSTLRQVNQEVNERSQGERRPLTDGIFRTQQLELLDRMKSIEKRFDQTERLMVKSFKEIKALIEEQDKQSFTIKNSQYEAELKHKTANLFCMCLTSYPKDDDLHSIIRETLTREDMGKKYKVQAAIKNCREMLSNCRTEERRKVLGIAPYQRACSNDTNTLCDILIDFFKASSEKVKADYLRHLILLRKFIKELYPMCIQQRMFHETFKKWAIEKYGDPLDILESEWERLTDEDTEHPYNLFPISYQTNEIADEHESHDEYLSITQTPGN